MTKDSFLETCKNLLERELKPTVPEVLPLVRFYCGQEGMGAGGCLHIFIEDGNTKDAHLKECRDFAHEWKDGGETGIPLCDVLLKMSETQRRKIYGAGYDYPLHTEPEHDPVPDFSGEPQEKYFPIAQLEKISGGLPPIDLSNLFATGSCFRKENVLFKVDSINNKKGTVTLKIEGMFGAIEGIK